jgi:hypothetical protein
LNEGGCIEYWVESGAVETLYWDDLRVRTWSDPPSGVAGIAKVQTGDLLRYGTAGHSTCVSDVEQFSTNPVKYRPTELTWKSNCSGVYKHDNTDATNRFATPIASICGYDPGVTWRLQGWGWEEEEWTGPGCWTEK